MDGTLWKAEWHGLLPAPSPLPSWHQLLLHTRLAAVRMVGFGFMDNIIMITAGSLINHTLSVKFGLSMLVAVAFGNLCSVTSGVLFGSVVELAAAWLKLELPNLTAAQSSMALTCRADTLGQLIGIFCGCCLGMTRLLFMDLPGAERLKMAKKLDTIFKSVLCSAHLLVDAE